MAQATTYGLAAPASEELAAFTAGEKHSSQFFSQIKNAVRFDRKQVLRVRVFCSCCMFVPTILGCGILEVMELRLNKGVFQSVNDDGCFVYLYPYSSDGTAYLFEVRSQQANRSVINREKDDKIIYVADLKGKAEVSAGKSYRLSTRECNHTLVPVVENSKKYSLHWYEDLDGSPVLRPLELHGCRKSSGGTMAEYAHHEDAVSLLALATLSLWACLRMMGPLRELLVADQDACRPPYVLRRGVKMGSVWPLNRIDSRPINWRNMFSVVLCPFVLYGWLPALVLKPWTSIFLHEHCPQIVMQHGQPGLLLAALASASIVLGWTVGSLARFMFSEDSSILEPRIIYVGNACIFTFILVFACIYMVLSWPLAFAVELQFNFSYPTFSISRWSHWLRIAAFCSFVFDLLSALLKINASHNLVFGQHFNQSLDNVTLPDGLRSLTFGRDFNQSLDNVILPAGLQSLTFGRDFNQSLDNVILPASLQRLYFGRDFNQSLDNVILPASLQILHFGRNFNQSLDNVTLFARRMI